MHAHCRESACAHTGILRWVTVKKWKYIFNLQLCCYTSLDKIQPEQAVVVVGDQQSQSCP